MGLFLGRFAGRNTTVCRYIRCRNRGCTSVKNTQLATRRIVVLQVLSFVIMLLYTSRVSIVWSSCGLVARRAARVL